MKSNKLFYTFAFGFFVSIFLSSFFKFGFTFAVLLLILSILLFIFSKIYLKNNPEYNRVLLFALVLFSFGLGVLRFEFSDIKKRDLFLDSQIGEKAVVEGLVIQEPEKKDSNVKAVVSLKKFENGTTTLNVFGKVLVKTDFYPEIYYGDYIKISGKIEKPENFETGDGTSFDYVSYLEKDDIYYQMNFAKVEIIASGQGNKVKTVLFNIKNAFLSKLKSQITEPQSSLLGGLLLGVKDSLGKAWEEKFRNAGVMHIVVLSGYNITIVAESIMRFFSFLPGVFSFSFGVLGIILFALMTGASSTVVRASLMAIVLLIARFIKRDYEIKRVLVLAGIIMLLFNPKILAFDSSFQLSFLATIALIFVSPIFSTRLGFITEKFGLKEIVSSTLATQFLVLPLILYKMNVFSLVFLPVNILILPFIPVTMFFGFLSGAFGFVSYIIAWPVSFISQILLSYELKVIDIFSSIPFSSVSVRGWGIIFVIIFYGVITFWLWKSKKMKFNLQDCHSRAPQ